MFGPIRVFLCSSAVSLEITGKRASRYNFGSWAGNNTKTVDPRVKLSKVVYQRNCIIRPILGD